MANTQVFTLGVTISPSLGSALDALRRQADGIRLGRLIGEVIRLGLELDRVRLVERALALEQAERHERQILRLGREIDQVERLRQRYLALSRNTVELRLRLPSAVNDSSPDTSPAAREARFREGVSLPPRPSRDGPPEPRRAEQGRVPMEFANPAIKVMGVLMGVAGTVLAAVGAYKGVKALPPNIRKAGIDNVKENLGPALWTTGFGLADAYLQEDGRDQAKSTGTGLGTLVGMLGGALIGGATKTGTGKKYGPVFGSILGAMAGGKLGGSFFDLVAGKPQDNGTRAIAQQDTVPSASTLGQTHSAEAGQQERQEGAAISTREGGASESDESASAITSAALGVTSLVGSFGKSRGSLPGASLARRLMRRVPGLSVLATGMQVADIYNSGATTGEKLEGYGAAVGGLGGGLAGAAAGAAIGSVVPVVGTLIGGLIGGALGSMGGEGIGGLLGKALSPDSDSDSAPLAPSADAPVALTSAAPAAPVPAPITQQFTFNANMPVTFTNSLSDPSVLQQLEAIARRQLEELMRQARSVQLADTPHVAL